MEVSHAHTQAHARTHPTADRGGLRFTCCICFFDRPFVGLIPY